MATRAYWLKRPHQMMDVPDPGSRHMPGLFGSFRRATYRAPMPLVGIQGQKTFHTGLGHAIKRPARGKVLMFGPEGEGEVQFRRRLPGYKGLGQATLQRHPEMGYFGPTTIYSMSAEPLFRRLLKKTRSRKSR
jgi:hypothetical protein